MCTLTRTWCASLSRVQDRLDLMKPCEKRCVRRRRPVAVLLLLLTVFSVCVMEWCLEARAPILSSDGSTADEDLLLAGDPNLLSDLDHHLLSDLHLDQLSDVNPHLLPGVDPDLLIEDYSRLLPDVVGGFKDEFFAPALDAFRAASEGVYPVLSQSSGEWLPNIRKLLEHWSPDQKQDLEQLLSSQADIFGDIPTMTTVIHHDIEERDNQPIKSLAYKSLLQSWI